MKQRIVSVTAPTSNPVSVIVTLAWPIFIEQILVSLVQSIDTAMVGSLGAMLPLRSPSAKTQST